MVKLHVWNSEKKEHSYLYAMQVKVRFLNGKVEMEYLDQNKMWQHIRPELNEVYTVMECNTYTTLLRKHDYGTAGCVWELAVKSPNKEVEKWYTIKISSNLDEIKLFCTIYPEYPCPDGYETIREVDHINGMK